MSIRSFFGFGFNKPKVFLKKGLMEKTQSLGSGNFKFQ